ncbi:hypothetical protein HYDPIDRAFT_171473 [Hydnomerulius pinastri MD-312]|uniref:Nucleoplasmin-like domain-containing protein n=1 Tax=Hydnomerulius pinastri MD-312 TaxID=994086 RepID=A0A0C9W6Q8_9AGAM|nr:hypothetical protein HYDPIDRAFT_171473 [Hydnomerulius pinastri MD-312]
MSHQDDEVRVVKVSVPAEIELQGLSLTFGYQNEGSVAFQFTVEPRRRSYSETPEPPEYDECAADKASSSEDNKENARTPKAKASVQEQVPTASTKRKASPATTPPKRPKSNLYHPMALHANDSNTAAGPSTEASDGPQAIIVSAAMVAFWKIQKERLKRQAQKKGGKKRPALSSCSRETSAITKTRQHSSYQAHADGSVSWTRKHVTSTQRHSIANLDSRAR